MINHLLYLHQYLKRSLRLLTIGGKTIVNDNTGFPPDSFIKPLHYLLLTSISICKGFFIYYSSIIATIQNAICIDLTWNKSRTVCQLHNWRLIAKVKTTSLTKSLKKVSGGKCRINTTEFNYWLPLMNLSSHSNIRI